MENFIINPQTNRLVKIGSPAYNKLVSEKIIQGEIIKKKGQNIVKEFDSNKKAVEYKEKLMKENPPPEGQKYSLDNTRKQVVIKNKKRPTKSMKSLLAQAAILAEDKLRKQNYGNGRENVTQDDIDMFSKQILKEMKALKSNIPDFDTEEENDLREPLRKTKETKNKKKVKIEQEESELDEDELAIQSQFKSILKKKEDKEKNKDNIYKKKKNGKIHTPSPSSSSSEDESDGTQSEEQSSDDDQ